MTSGFLLMIMLMMMIASADALKCIECSSLTDDNCAFNATLVDSECTSSATCFETYDASKPGKPTERGCSTKTSTGCASRTENGVIRYHSCTCAYLDYCNSKVVAQSAAGRVAYSTITYAVVGILAAFTRSA